MSFASEIISAYCEPIARENARLVRTLKGNEIEIRMLEERVRAERQRRVESVATMFDRLDDMRDERDDALDEVARLRRLVYREAI
jgi:hypothetical protein